MFSYDGNNQLVGRTLGEVANSTNITSSSCGGYIPFYGVRLPTKSGHLTSRIIGSDERMSL
jgi:hypothetical protein